MEGRIQKWGNSLAIRIPRAFARQAGLAENCQVDISLDKDCLIIRPCGPAMFDLAGMLSGITEQNRHGEVAPDASVGGEAW